MKDEWTGLGIRVMLSSCAAVWRFPLETISQSEDGIEKTYQGSSVLVHWKMTLHEHQEQKLKVMLQLYEFPGRSVNNS